jgi:hypothetical protein
VTEDIRHRMAAAMARVADNHLIPLGMGVLDLMAGAALTALREPTAAMIEAGEDSADWGPCAQNLGPDATPKRCWQAMIDAALTPKSA